MTQGSADAGNAAGTEYAKAVGARLRAVRTAQHLSLHAVERKSGGKWKAVVVGSYERGDRAVSVQKLAELAEFYGVSTGDLLPGADGLPEQGAGTPPLSRIVLNVDKVQRLAAPGAEILRRFVGSILRQRSDPTAASLPVRHQDLGTLALMYDTTVDELTTRLVRWQVLAPESIIVDS